MACLPWYIAGQEVKQRSPQEEAEKQTERLCRYLELTDSVQRKQLYFMYLKYAKQRAVSNTRSEALQRLFNQMNELKQILTPEQYDRFMNEQLTQAPRQPRNPIGSMPKMQKEPATTGKQ